LVNEEGAKLQAVTPIDVQASAREILRTDNCTTLYYRAQPRLMAPATADSVEAATAE
jgi:zinc protease